MPPREFFTGSTPGTFLVALVLCVACSFFVAGAAVSLKQKQDVNKEVFKQKNALMAAGLAELRTPPGEVQKVFSESIDKLLVDLDTGKVVSEGDADIDIDSYDPEQAAKDPKLAEKVTPPSALPGIPTREPYAFVYLIKKDGQPDGYIFPIYGKGLWSTLKGFLAVQKDGETVRGITFYQHGETPGLGGEVDNPGWKGLWNGKKIYDSQGDVELGVVKGQGTDEYSVDGLSGATMTSRGVDNMIKYWLGPQGFGKYLEAQRAGSEG